MLLSDDHAVLNTTANIEALRSLERDDDQKSAEAHILMEWSPDGVIQYVGSACEFIFGYFATLCILRGPEYSSRLPHFRQLSSFSIGKH